MRPAIIIFAKSPEPGKVKTRLAQTIGFERAVSLYLAMVRDTAKAARKSGASVLWRVDGEPGALKEIIGNDKVKSQCGGDLGARLSVAFEEAFSRGLCPVAAVGTDCPSLGEIHLRDLLEKSAGFDAAFIPSPDGGYSAIALRAPLPAVFGAIPWSSPDTLKVSIKRITCAGKSHCLLDPLEDIDDIESLRRFSKSLSGKNRSGASETGRILLSPEFAFLT